MCGVRQTDLWKKKKCVKCATGELPSVESPLGEVYLKVNKGSAQFYQIEAEVIIKMTQY